MEGLQSVEGLVGGLEDRGRGGRAEGNGGRKSGRARAIRRRLILSRFKAQRRLGVLERVAHT